MKVLVLGASGMLGSAMVRVLSESGDLEVLVLFDQKKLKNFLIKIFLIT